MSRALYAGSFDPPTNGHLWVIFRAISLFGTDGVVVAVAHNPAKSRVVPISECAGILHASGAPRVIFCPPSRYVADLAADQECEYLVRGLRGAEDIPHEQALRDFAEERQSLTTIVLMPPPRLRGLSSSYVRALVGPTGWEDVVRPLVPEATLEYLKGTR